MDFITLVTVIAFLLIAVNISSKDKNPWLMLIGLGLLGVGIVSRLFGGGGFFEIVIPLFTDAGLSMLAAAGWLMVRKAKADPQPFFVLGLISLGLAGVLYLGTRVLGIGLDAPTQQASFLLELGPDDRIEEVAPLLDRYGATYEDAFPTIPLEADEDLAQVYLIHGDPATFEALMEALRADTENVDFVELNIEVSLTPLIESDSNTPNATRDYLENDPRVAEQWALEAVRGHEAHALLSELKPVRKARVAILDTGVDWKT